MASEQDYWTGRGLTFGPAPSEFDLAPFDPGVRIAAEMSDRGVCFWLCDALVDLRRPERIWTSRVLKQITGSDGLDSAARLDITYNPAFERVVVHDVLVHRNGAVRRIDGSAAFEIYRREPDLERAIYDGRLTAHLVIPDLRIGDVVETCYSVIGANPLLKGLFGTHFRFQWATPAAHTRCRVLAATDRELVTREFGDAPRPIRRSVGEAVEWSWSTWDLAPYRHDPASPLWWIGYAAVHVTDRLTWAEVADLYRPGYEAPARLPEELEAEVVRLEAQASSRAETVLEALRLVQGQLRYHSVSVGSGGLVPRDVETIWRTRYGDCKDASLLLTAILRRLGVDAAPALVDTRSGPDLADQPPHVHAFNHCIVRMRLDGRVWWLDPTKSPQSGDLDHVTQARHQWALPLVEGARLEPMPEPDASLTYDALETWTFPLEVSKPALLELKSTYRRLSADDMRRWIAKDGAATVGARLREDLERDYGAMRATSDIEVRDHAAINELEVIERYEVPGALVLDDAGTTATFNSRDDIVAEELRTPPSGRRIEPINLGAPRRARSRRVFNLPVEADIPPWSDVYRGPGVEGRNELRWITDRQALAAVEITVTRRWLPPEEAEGYFAFDRKMRANNGIVLKFPVRKGRLRPPDDTRVGPLGWFVIFALVLAAGLWRVFGA